MNLGIKPWQIGFSHARLAERFQKLLTALFFCLAPKMKEAPSIEGAFLVSATPPIGKAPGVGYLEGRGIGSRSVKVTGRRQSTWLPSRLRGATHGPLGSSSATPNLA